MLIGPEIVTASDKAAVLRTLINISVKISFRPLPGFIFQ